MRVLSKIENIPLRIEKISALWYNKPTGSITEGRENYDQAFL
jgi:hypothetical protein